MEIQVHRPKQFYDFARTYRLYVNNVEVGQIRRGETKTITVSDTAKTIQARIDWCTSQEFALSDVVDNKITVKNAFAHNIFRVLFMATYYISKGKHKYLVIESGVAE